MKHESILGLIGDTPLVGIHALSPNPDVKIYAKLEGQNPGGSAKDRIALKMVELAERDGLLEPGDTILEPSSGNTGIGLALVAKLRGYRLRVVMPDNVSIERRQLLEIFGAEIVLSPGEEGSNGGIRLAEKLAADDPTLKMLFQYGNPANPLAHYEGTGPEIVRDVPDITHFVAGLGTSGTLMGTGRRLREYNPAIQIISLQPDSPFNGLEGLKHMETAILPGIYDPTFADRDLRIRTETTYDMARRLAREVGYLVGISAAAAMVGSLQIAEELAATRSEPATIVTIFPDNAYKYLSEPFWTK